MTKSSRVIRHEAFLNFLRSASPTQRKQILRVASKEQILAVCEGAYNIVKKNVPLTQKEIEQLRRFRRVLYDIADSHISLTEKKKILVQKGGLAFLPALLAPILGSLLGAAVSR